MTIMNAKKTTNLGNKVGESSQAECLQRGIDNRHNGFEKLKRIAAVLPHIAVMESTDQ